MVDNRIKRAADAAMGGGGQGYNIGGGYVTVGVDFSGARQEMAAFKQELGSYFAGSVVSPLGGGGLGAGNAAPAGGTQTGGASGLPGIGMPTAGGFAGFAGMPGTPGTGLEITYGAPAGGTPGGGGGGGGGGSGGGGGDGGGGNPWWMKNIFRPTTLFQQLGAPVGLFYGAESWGRVGQGFYEANFVAQHPEGNIEALGQFGSGLGMYGQSSVRGAIGTVQGIDETLAMRQAIYQMPLLGGYLAAFDWGPGSSTELNYNRSRTIQTTQRLGSALGTSREAGERYAAATQDQLQVAELAGANQLRGLQEQADVAHMEERRTAKAAIGATGFSIAETTASSGQQYYQFGSAGKETVEAWQRASAAANAASTALENMTKAVNTSSGEIARGMRNRAAVGMASAAGTYASPFAGEQGMMEAQINVLGKMEESALSDYSTRPNDETFAAYQNASAARSAAQDNLRYSIRDRDRANSRDIELGRMDIAEAQRVAHLQFMSGQDSSAASTNAQLLSMGNDPFGAQMAGLRASQDRNAGDPNPITRGLERYRLNRLGEAMGARHQFELDVFNDTSDAAIRAAGDRGNFRPLTADAEMSVANARTEVSNAPNDQRQKTTERLTAELATQSKLLTQQLGGQVALDTNAYTAMGMPSVLGLDLTNRQQDVTGARGVYAGAALGDSRHAPQANTLNEKVGEDVNNIYQWLQKLKSAGVSMFTTQ